MPRPEGIELKPLGIGPPFVGGYFSGLITEAPEASPISNSRLAGKWVQEGSVDVANNVMGPEKPQRAWIGMSVAEQLLADILTTIGRLVLATTLGVKK
jgi:hypothetical protein